jgi:hypothetical protein
MSGDVAGALEFGQSADPGDRLQRIEVAALLQQARESHDSANAKARLVNLYERTRDARFLMLWAEQQAFDGNWQRSANEPVNSSERSRHRMHFTSS